MVSGGAVGDLSSAPRSSDEGLEQVSGVHGDGASREHALDCRVACKGVPDGGGWLRACMGQGPRQWPGPSRHVGGIWAVRQAVVPEAGLMGLRAGLSTEEPAKEKVRGDDRGGQPVFWVLKPGCTAPGHRWPSRPGAGAQSLLPGAVGQPRLSSFLAMSRHPGARAPSSVSGEGSPVVWSPGGRRLQLPVPPRPRPGHLQLPSPLPRPGSPGSCLHCVARPTCTCPGPTWEVGGAATCVCVGLGGGGPGPGSPIRHRPLADGAPRFEVANNSVAAASEAARAQDAALQLLSPWSPVCAATPLAGRLVLCAESSAGCQAPGCSRQSEHAC